MVKQIITPLILLLSFKLSATSEVLTLDKVNVQDIEFAFENDRNLFPDVSEFKINHTVLMSNEIGERWGVLTITNQSSGRRQLQDKHIMALFADGTRHIPTDFKQVFNGNETQSITLNFGQHKFPILSIYTRN